MRAIGTFESPYGPSIAVFDRDGTLEGFGGPVPFALLKQLQSMGWLLCTGGSDDPVNQERDWLAHGVQPDILYSKAELNLLAARYPNSRVIYVDDGEAYRGIASMYHWRFLSPQEALWATREL